MSDEKTNQENRQVLKKLKLAKGQTFRIYIEENIQEDSLFFHHYEIAANTLNHIWRIQKDIRNDATSGYDTEYPNNIIAFCGERGSGKSSAMMSFIHAVEKAGQNKGTGKIKFDNEIMENSWDARIIIDPSMFDGVHNIVDIVLAHIYQDFNEAYQENNQRLDNYEREKMIRQLSKVYKGLSIIKDKEKMLNDEYDMNGNITKLEKLGESTMLKKEIKKLIALYLDLLPKLKDKKEKKNEKLLIAVDDLDLCNENAYQMAEQIRKYLVLPNVIIVMAIKIEQLELGVEEKNREDFQHVIKSRGADGTIDREMRTMAERYVTKLIPQARRIYLSELKSNEVQLELASVRQDRDVEELPANDMEKAVITLIRKKTGMIFVPAENGYSYFLPENLRELVNFISMLDEMKVPGDSEKIRLENINEFKTYFIEEMLKKNIGWNKLKDFIEVIETEERVKNFSMGNYLNGLLMALPNAATIYSNAVWEFPNTSLATVMEKLNIASGYMTTKEDYHLFYYIRIYYTIILNERLCVGKGNPFLLVNGFIWGNLINGIIPRIKKDNYFVPINRERFYVRTLKGWNVIADVLYEFNDFLFIESKTFSSNYVSKIKEGTELSETVCWILFALLSSQFGSNNRGGYYASKEPIIHNNSAVLDFTAVSVEDYFVNLCDLQALYEIINLELLGIEWEDACHIFTMMEERNAKLIRQAKELVVNADLSNRLLEYCGNAKKKDYKKATESEEDRTYQTVKLFFENARRFMDEAGVGAEDWTRFWIPVRKDADGRIEGDYIDICRIYARLYMAAVEDEKISDSNSDSIEKVSDNMLVDREKVQKAKRDFAKKVERVAEEDFTGKTDKIFSLLRIRKVSRVKGELENLANKIQKYSFREKKLPDGLQTDSLITLYAEVVDMYVQNPEAELTDSQYENYKKIAKIKDIIE